MGRLTVKGYKEIWGETEMFYILAVIAMVTWVQTFVKSTAFIFKTEYVNFIEWKVYLNKSIEYNFVKR